MRKRASSSFTFLSLTSIMISIGLVLNIAIIYASFGMHFTLAQPQQQNKQQQQQQISLTAVLEDQGDPARWKSLLQPAMQELRVRHPNMNINLNYTTYPYDQARTYMLAALTDQTPIDLISVDQIWLGEFAEKGPL
jgi:multiple sugar transport system substrate-binding protein